MYTCVCEDTGVWCTGELYSYILADTAVFKYLALYRKLPVSAWLFQIIPARCPELWLQSRHWTWMTMHLNWTGSTQQPCATHPPSGRSVYVEVIFAFSVPKLQFKALCVKKMIFNIIFQFILLEQAFVCMTMGQSQWKLMQAFSPFPLQEHNKK